MLKNKSLIIFYWDGTLMDSIGLIVNAMRYSPEKNGVSVTDEATKSIIGIALVESIALLFPDVPQKHEQILNDYASFYVEHCDDDKLFDGVQTLIATLHQQGKILAIATGKKRQGLERVLPNSGIEHFFSITKTADETAGKPNPLMLEQILAETGKSLEDAVMIGDSVHDINMANNIGMDSIAVSYGCEKADVLASKNPTVVVHSVVELSNLFI